MLKDLDINEYQEVINTEIRDYLSFDADESMKLKHGELVKNMIRDANNVNVEDDKMDIERDKVKADKKKTEVDEKLRLKQMEFEQERWNKEHELKMKEFELKMAQFEQDKLDKEQQRRINEKDAELRERDMELREKEAEHREYVDLENLKIKKEEMSNYDKLMNRQFSWQKEADEKRLALEQQRLIEDQRRNKTSGLLELAKVGVLGWCGYKSIKKGFELGMNGLSTDLNGYNESPATLKLGESMINSSNKFTHF